MKGQTVRRFHEGLSPEGAAWKPSERTKGQENAKTKRDSKGRFLEGSGKTLLDTGRLRSSISFSATALEVPEWLKEFCYRLAAALPRGFNDPAGNYVKLVSARGEWENFAVRRVGGTVIEPLVKRGYLLHITVTWRITAEELVDLVNKVELKIGGIQ